MSMFGMGDAFDFMIMDEDERQQEIESIVDMFETEIALGNDPEDVESNIWLQSRIDPNDLTVDEQEYISRTVNELYKLYQ